MTPELTQWLLESDEPWTRYRTLVDLLDRPEDDPEVQAARAEMLAHPQVQALIAEAAAWPGYALQRHNDASHPIHKFSTLADFGVRADDPGPVLSHALSKVEGAVEGMAAGIEAVMAHQSPEGAFQTPVNISKSFGGTGEDTWSWMLCDAPTLLYALLAFGLGDDPLCPEPCPLGLSRSAERSRRSLGTKPEPVEGPVEGRVQRAADHLVGLVDENGWRCIVAPELGKFRGPGRKDDPCPIVNVYALKALSQVPELLDSPATRAGAEMVLSHWEHQGERKIYMFGIGTDFRKLKYPFVWYDILHVVDVLSRFPFVHADPRFHEMVETITAQADGSGRYTASSMYKTWKGWSFADKKNPSPWLTFLALRAQRRLEPTHN